MAVLALMTGACGDDDGGADGGARPARDGSVDPGDPVGLADSGIDAGGAGEDASAPSGSGVVQGRVALTDGNTVGGVAVEIDGQTVMTDNRGLFRLEGVAAGKRQVKVVAPDFTSAQATVDLAPDATAQLSLTVLALESMSLNDAAGGGTMAQNQVAVTLPPNALRTRAGALVSGAVEARYAVVSDPTTLAAAPGGMRAEMAGGEQVELESFGMIDMKFFQGNELLELDAEADLEFPMGPNAFADGDEFDLWSFDETLGLWKNEGKGTVDKSAGGNGIAKLKATHMSWWNADQPLSNTACLTGTMLSVGGDPIGGIQINVTGIDYLTNLSAVTAADGTFCVNVKLGSQNRLTAFGGAGISFQEWSADATAGAEPAACGMDTCVDVGTLMGQGLFDECTMSVAGDQNHVLLLSSSDAILDAQIETMLEGYGNTVTLGPQFTAFDGTTDLSAYDVVYLQANVNWASGDMPVEGQRQLVNWINCGGGLVTVEWTVWKIGTGQFSLLDAVYPTTPNTLYGSTAMGTYIQQGDDATVHNGLPAMFTFIADNHAGTEIDLIERPGATVFYDSQERLAGVVGWDFNMGRVVSISTTGGPNEISDPNYSRMVANVVDWLQRDEPNEPQ